MALQAMNRSLANVILGGYGTSSGPAMKVEGTHQETDLVSTTEALTMAKNVIIVPGYGLAVANAQYAIAGGEDNSFDNPSRLTCGSEIFLLRLHGLLKPAILVRLQIW